MEAYNISNKKLFMNKLLKSELFDTFEVREIIIHAASKCIIDGKRNNEFYSSEELESLTTYLSWQELRQPAYHLMTGNKLPTYFKMVLSTSEMKTQSISEAIDTCFLNITFKDNLITCGTGVSYKTFTLDKTPETIWDEKMKQFLFKYDFL